MAFVKSIVLNILFILKFVNNSVQTTYDFTLEEEEVFSECQEKHPEYLNMDQMLDFSHTSFSMSEEGVSVEGNMTFCWDIDPKDRLEASTSVSYFDRGSWQATVLNIKYKDFCVSMFDPKQFWYKFWTKHVRNAEYAMKVCPLPGITFVLEPYTLNLQFGFDVPLKPGRYKIVLLFSAIDVDEEEEVFSECQEKLPEYLNMDQMLDFSHTSFSMSEEGVSVEGNMTFCWDIDPKDRLEASTSVSYFDRGSWQATVLNIKYKDFCVSMFDPKQFWYQFWTKHVLNAEYLMKVCPLPGITFVLEPYTLNLRFGFDVPLKPGRYKIVLLFSAIDVDGKVRDKKICAEIRGSFMK
ncbi:uncharacterized protein [Drosophila bipectinata]|uniref:uncharacterized protein isoform X2 n=1 Tax=Drosophila bipectinata TaxID=42026 RepID=UPI0038B3AC00